MQITTEQFPKWHTAILFAETHDMGSSCRLCIKRISVWLWRVWCCNVGVQQYGISVVLLYLECKCSILEQKKEKTMCILVYHMNCSCMLHCKNVRGHYMGVASFEVLCGHTWSEISPYPQWHLKVMYRCAKAQQEWITRDKDSWSTCSKLSKASEWLGENYYGKTEPKTVEKMTR